MHDQMYHIVLYSRTVKAVVDVDSAQFTIFTLYVHGKSVFSARRFPPNTVQLSFHHSLRNALRPLSTSSKFSALERLH